MISYYKPFGRDLRITVQDKKMLALVCVYDGNFYRVNVNTERNNAESLP